LFQRFGDAIVAGTVVGAMIWAYGVPAHMT
jgi:hypothetical protein